MTTVAIASREWEVTVATTAAEKAAGLGGLASIPAGSGMLFAYDSVQPITVTTEPMLFNLDIIFITQTTVVYQVSVILTVAQVDENVAPNRLIAGEGKYFLEVNAGEASGLQIGDVVVITETTPPPEPPTQGLDITSLLSAMMVMVMIMMMSEMS